MRSKREDPHGNISAPHTTASFHGWLRVVLGATMNYGLLATGNTEDSSTPISACVLPQCRTRGGSASHVRGEPLPAVGGSPSRGRWRPEVFTRFTVVSLPGS